MHTYFPCAPRRTPPPLTHTCPEWRLSAGGVHLRIFIRGSSFLCVLVLLVIFLWLVPALHGARTLTAAHAVAVTLAPWRKVSERDCAPHPSLV